MVIPIMSLALRRHRLRNLINQIEWHESQILDCLANMAELVGYESDCADEVRRLRELLDA